MTSEFYNNDILIGHSSGQPVYWKLNTYTNSHLVIVGLPSTGKTTLLGLCCQQMQRMGITPIIFSQHADLDRMLASALGNDIKYVDYNGLGFNPLRVLSTDPDAHVNSIYTLRDIFGGIFSDLGDIQLAMITDALKACYADMGWYVMGNDKATLAVPSFQAFFDKLQNNDVDRKLLARLDELDAYGFFRSASEPLGILSSGKPIIIRLHKTQNEVLRKAFSSFMVYYICQEMFTRGEQYKITHVLVFDEAHEIASLKMVPKLAKQGRKYGIAEVLASQEVTDFDSSILNLAGNFITMRLNVSDARKMAKIMTTSDDVKELADNIKNLQQYHACYKSMESQNVINITLSGKTWHSTP